MTEVETKKIEEKIQSEEEESDIWECLKCGTTFPVDKGVKPLLCPNSVCRNQTQKYFHAKSGPYIYFNDGKFTPKLLADDILKEHYFMTMEDSKEIYYYNDGIYHEGGENLIAKKCRDKLGNEFRSNRVREVVEYIKISESTPRSEINKDPYIIATENCLLNIKSLETFDFSPEIKMTMQIPIKYDPTKTCPEIKKVIEEIMDPKAIPIFQEYAGYILYNGNPYEKALIFIGEGANGKSTLIKLIQKILGEDNFSTVSLQELIFNRFASSELYGKIANVQSEIPKRKLTKTDMFKNVTSGDLISAEKKFRDRFKFRYSGKQIYSANEVPETDDKTYAFYRRWIVVNLPYKFVDNPQESFERKKDPHLLDKVITEEEKSGFLNWILEGLHRLLENDKFSQHLTYEEIVEIWERMSNPVIAFLEDYTEFDGETEIMKDEFYQVYVSYCKDKGIPVRDKAVFARGLSKEGLMPTRPHIDGKRVHCWKGRKWSEDAKIKKENNIISDQSDLLDENNGLVRDVRGKKIPIGYFENDNLSRLKTDSQTARINTFLNEVKEQQKRQEDGWALPLHKNTYWEIVKERGIPEAYAQALLDQYADYTGETHFNWKPSIQALEELKE